MNEAGYVSRGELQNRRYLVTGCHKPGSRKQLKRTMMDNKDLGSFEMYQRLGRIPGKGRARSWVHKMLEDQKTAAELREIARAERKAEAVKAEAKIPSLGKRIIGAVTRMFNRRGSRGA